MKAPLTTDELLRAIHALPMPDDTHERLVEQRQAALRQAHAEHERLGRLLAGRIAARFTRRGFSAEVRPSAYMVSHGREQPVRPYLSVKVYLRHGLRVELSYLPDTEKGLDEWCRTHFAWLATAPAEPKEPAKPKLRAVSSPEVSRG